MKESHFCVESHPLSQQVTGQIASKQQVKIEQILKLELLQ
jgi:hypothetical protein